ncbi:hypothetical protein H7U32_01440 [Bifidobacterium pullorum subsp. saeculare]|uniref:Uncharacterized protein n=1 Tax=Bifidobacterium pullorum subsp. saeculare TaxID=78257 RepID=A0A938WUK2_9BIFI|nr:hypothetical protein [Bifidobacterium pullorum]MBM6699010.1 hypothetical protein [Bifidobacterium pullorum subsp. saeculare]
MPQVGVGVSVMTLTNDKPSTKTTTSVQRAAREFGDERESATAHIDPARSSRNVYDFPEGCGTSGDAVADWFVLRLEDYALEYGKTHRSKPDRHGKTKPRKLPSNTAVGVGCVITPDEEAVAQWDAALREKFMRDAREVYELWLGARLDAWAIHVDEGAMAERGLTRADELGDEGLHGHGAGRMPDRLPDDEFLVEAFGEEGAAQFKARYKGEGDGCLYRTGKLLNGGRLKLLHNIFPAEMAKRGWREKTDENDLEATGWSVRPHLSYGEKKQIEEETGKVFKPAGQSANKYAKTQRWQREQEEKAAKNAADEKRNTADAERNADMRRVISENAAWNEEEARALDRRADELEREARDARVEISHEHRRLAAREDEADRMRARAEVALHGYEPPAGVELVPPSAMPPELRALWRLTDDDAAGDIPGDLLGEDGRPDVDAANERVDDLADEFARERGYREAFVGKEGAWLVTLPLEYVRQQPGYEDVESLDELTDADRQYWEERHWDEASLRIADAQLFGLDPTVPHPGIDEREAAVEAARTDVERREKTVEAHEAALERVVARKRSEVERIDAELEAKGAESKRLDEANEAKRAEAARLDAEADEKARWLEGAVEHVKEADAYVERARAEAGAVRERAERDAQATREQARAEREEALRGITDRAEERITGFLSRVVGDVGYIAYRTLSVMVEMGVGGERFASAARTCMDVINAMSEDAIGRPFSQALSGRVQERVARSFARAFARDARRDAAVREVDDAPQAGRSRDDGPVL